MFVKGNSGNPQGRPYGSKNKARKTLYERVGMIVEKNMGRLQQDLDSLDPAERVKAIVSILNFVLPKKQSIDVKAQIQAEYEALAELLERCPDDAVEKIVERIVKLREAKNG